MKAVPRSFRNRQGIDRQGTLSRVSFCCRACGDLHTAVAISESGEESSENHDETSRSNGDLSAEMIGHVGRERETGNTTNLVDRVEDTKLGSLGMTKVILPIVHGLGSVQHGTANALSVSFCLQFLIASSYPS